MSTNKFTQNEEILIKELQQCPDYVLQFLLQLTQQKEVNSK